MRRGRLTSLLLLVFALAMAVAASAPAWAALAQDQPPITLDVRVGYEGTYRIGEWFPVSVSIGNDGPDLRGMLEWSFTSQTDEQVFRQVIDLPRGSRKRVTLEVFARDFARTGQLRLLDGENPLVARDVNLDAADVGVFLAGCDQQRSGHAQQPQLASNGRLFQHAGAAPGCRRSSRAHGAAARPQRAVPTRYRQCRAQPSPARCFEPVGQLGRAAVCQRRGRRAEGRRRPG